MERVEGFYWVKYEGEWIIAEYDMNEWYKTGVENFYEDSHLDEIDERRIEREYHDGPKQAAESIWLINKLFKK